MGPDEALMYLVLYLTGMAQRKRAGLITPRSLVRSQFPVFTICRLSETDGHSSSDPKQEPHSRGSAGAARGAHNLEVVRSKRTPGICTFADLSESAPLSLQQPLTALAHRKSARLITVR